MNCKQKDCSVETNGYCHWHGGEWRARFESMRKRAIAKWCAITMLIAAIAAFITWLFTQGFKMEPHFYEKIAVGDGWSIAMVVLTGIYTLFFGCTLTACLSFMWREVKALRAALEDKA